MNQQTNMAVKTAADLVQAIATRLYGDAGAGVTDLIGLNNLIQGDVGIPVSPSPAGQGDALRAELLEHADGLERMAAGDREAGESIEQAIEDGEGYTPDDPQDVAAGLQHDANMAESTATLLRKAAAALAARQPTGQGPLWCMHILGPDDVHAAPSKAHAEKAAAALNAFHAARQEQSEQDPKIEAVATLWPHSAESHAESVAAFIPGWMLPQWQVEAIRTNAPPARAVDHADFKALYRAYVRLLEAGRDRILLLGGDCDPVDVMEASDADLRAARSLIDSVKPVSND